MEEQRARRLFTPEQKFAILKAIERCATIQEGLEKSRLHYMVYRRWKRQLAGGVWASLRNHKPLQSPDTKRLEAEHRKRKEVVLNQSLGISELKKERPLDCGRRGD